MIQKSPNDKCQYSTFTIPDNNLRVFMIEDQIAKECCVAMSVGIGYAHDTLPGIAHFLEHMLFMGTTSYPNEEYFTEYITKNGGYTNAYTSHLHTCYYYTISPAKIEESLKVFSSFFIDPLLKKSCVDRELSAVDSEHTKNINEDGWRHEHVCTLASHSDHANKKFGTGNNTTLRVPDVDIIVREFYETHYSAELMTLVVLTPSISLTEQYIRDSFKHVPVRQITKNPSERLTGQILDTPKLFKVIPIKNKNKIIMLFNVPSFQTTPKSNPNDFMSHIIGHEGEHTLQNVLMERGMIVSLASGVESTYNDYSIFKIELTLTPTADPQSCIMAVFSYINLIAEADLSQQYAEYCEIMKLNYRYTTKQSLENTVLGILENLLGVFLLTKYFHITLTCVRMVIWLTL